MSEDTPLVALCCPTYTKPFPEFVAAVEAAVPAMDAAGIRHKMKFEVGSPYISGARATLLRDALDAKADIIVFLDHDISFRPEDLVTLIQTPGDVVAGLYRYKKPGEPEEYMGALARNEAGGLIGEPGRVKALQIPAGFMKITKEAVARFMKAYPALCYGPGYHQSVDLFNHGAHDGVWWGEDMAFSRNWTDMGGEIWVIPDLDLTHHNTDAAYPGNLHQHLMRQPGASLDPARIAA